MSGGSGGLSARRLEDVRRSRRHPRRTQFDYLHLSYLNRDLKRALAALEAEAVRDVLDVYAGARPYDDLYPAGARVTALDVPGNPYGVADVVTDDFLPFADASFDLVACIEAFHYVADPVAAIAEFHRVLRPGGRALVSVPFVWEYDPSILERRFTGPELRHLFASWDEVEVVENGGRSVAWATLTGSLLTQAQLRLPQPLRRSFVVVYLLLNAFAAAVARVEERTSSGRTSLPMNLLVTARRPA